MQRIDICVDIGNSRVKWGRAEPTHITATTSLADTPEEWELQARTWNLPAGSVRWCLATVHPARGDQFAAWAEHRGDLMLRLDSYQQLPIRARVDQPERVGIDRLLNAIGSRSMANPHEPAIVVDAGTAVTVDAVHQDFLGGSILPGLRLMADSLHRHTAKLPCIDDFSLPVRVPGKNTVEAIRGGIIHLLLGGITRLATQLTQELFAGTTPRLLLTGGDGPRLHSGLGPEWKLVPALTLEGIRIAAQANS